jgi:hypothetical protein
MESFNISKDEQGNYITKKDAKFAEFLGENLKKKINLRED